MTSDILETILNLENYIIDSFGNTHLIVTCIVINVNLDMIVQLDEEFNHTILNPTDSHNIDLFRFGNTIFVEIGGVNELLVTKFSRSGHTG
jgi:hypothetical protein